MAEMIGLTPRRRPRNGMAGGLFAALRLGLSRLVRGRAATRLQFDEWPDYLLRDVGLERRSMTSGDPRRTDWLQR